MTTNSIYAGSASFSIDFPDPSRILQVCSWILNYLLREAYMKFYQSKTARVKRRLKTQATREKISQGQVRDTHGHQESRPQARYRQVYRLIAFES